MSEEVVLRALKREHERLAKIHQKAKAEADKCSNIGSELVAIHKEFLRIMQSGAPAGQQLKELEALQKREQRAERIRKKDILALFDKETKALLALDEVAREVATVEFRISMRARAR